MKNKKNNKGFSLVELIVVVAIMAVLVAVLAPTLLRYVEKTRVQKDASAVSEVVQAVKIALADEDINKATSSGDKVVIVDSEDATELSTGNNTSLSTELGKTIGTVKFSSANADDVTITIEMDEDGTPTLTVDTEATGAWGDAVKAVTP